MLINNVYHSSLSRNFDRIKQPVNTSELPTTRDTCLFGRLERAGLGANERLKLI